MIHINLNTIFYTHVEHSPTTRLPIKPFLLFSSSSSFFFFKSFFSSSSSPLRFFSSRFLPTQWNGVPARDERAAFLSVWRRTRATIGQFRTTLITWSQPAKRYVDLWMREATNARRLANQWRAAAGRWLWVVDKRGKREEGGRHGHEGRVCCQCGGVAVWCGGGVAYAATRDSCANCRDTPPCSSRLSQSVQERGIHVYNPRRQGPWASVTVQLWRGRLRAVVFFSFYFFSFFFYTTRWHHQLLCYYCGLRRAVIVIDWLTDWLTECQSVCLSVRAAYVSRPRVGYSVCPRFLRKDKVSAP